MTPGQTVNELYFILSGHVEVVEEDELKTKSNVDVLLGGQILRLDKENKNTTTKATYGICANVESHLEVLIVNRNIVRFLENFNGRMAQRLYERVTRHTKGRNFIKILDSADNPVPGPLLKYIKKDEP